MTDVKAGAGWPPTKVADSLLFALPIEVLKQIIRNVARFQEWTPGTYLPYILFESTVRDEIPPPTSWVNEKPEHTDLNSCERNSPCYPPKAFLSS